MGHRRSKMLQWAPMVMSKGPWQLPNTAACAHAHIFTWWTTRHKLYSSLRASLCEIVFMLTAVELVVIKLVIGSYLTIGNDLKRQETSFFCSVSNIGSMNMSINNVANNSSTERFSTIQNHVRSCRLATRKRRGRCLLWLCTDGLRFAMTALWLISHTFPTEQYEDLLD